MTVERRLTGVGQWVGRWEVRSDRIGKDGQPVIYIVSKTSDNRFGCNCPAWKFQKSGQRKDCKHIDKVKRTIGLTNIGVRIKADDFETVLRDVAERSAAFERALGEGRSTTTAPRPQPANLARPKRPPEPPTELARPVRKFRFER